MSDWVTATGPLSTDEPVRANMGHAFVPPSKKLTWPQYCRYCGHIPLKNEISRLVTKIGCGFEADHRYRAWRRAGGSR